MSSTPVSLRHPVLVDLAPGALVRDAIAVVAGAALTGIAAQVAIPTPLSPVPFTLQTMTVLVTGAALGPVRGATSMLLYAAAGSVGVPWFAGHASGFGGPSFGYIVGFIVAASLVGALARRGADRSLLGTLGLMASGSAIVYLIGTTWLALDLGIGAGAALGLGVAPFLLTDAIKALVAALVFPSVWRIARRFGG